MARRAKPIVFPSRAAGWRMPFDDTSPILPILFAGHEIGGGNLDPEVQQVDRLHSGKIQTSHHGSGMTRIHPQAEFGPRCRAQPLGTGRLDGGGAKIRKADGRKSGRTFEAVLPKELDCRHEDHTG